MKTTKMSLANMQGKLSRAEMKNIMAGYYTPPINECNTDQDCLGGTDINCNGTVIHSGPGRCYDSGTGCKCHYSVAC